MNTPKSTMSIRLSSYRSPCISLSLPVKLATYWPLTIVGAALAWSECNASCAVTQSYAVAEHGTSVNVVVAVLSPPEMGNVMSRQIVVGLPPGQSRNVNVIPRVVACTTGPWIVTVARKSLYAFTVTVNVQVLALP